LSGIKAIKVSLSKMSAENSEGTNKTMKTVKLAQADLQTLPSRVIGLFTREISTTMAKNHATCSKILTEARPSSIRTDQNVEEIKMAIQSLLSNESTNQITTLLIPSLEQAISDRITSSVEAFAAHRGSLQAESRRPGRRPDPDKDTSSSTTRRYPENQFGAASLNDLSYTTTCVRWTGESKFVNCWFGRLILATSVLDSWEDYRNGETHRETKFLETKATLILSKWLLRKGAVLKITRLISAVAAPSIQLSLTPLLVLAEDDEIVSAMQLGNLAKVQRLIRSRNVHKSSIFPDGSSLAHKCMNAFLEKFQKDVKVVKLSPGVVHEAIDLSDIAGIALWLVNWGSDVDTIDIHGMRVQ
jgi:hypothetical protein